MQLTITVQLRKDGLEVSGTLHTSPFSLEQSSSFQNTVECRVNGTGPHPDFQNIRIL